jgi:hypothetical protein
LGRGMVEKESKMMVISKINIITFITFIIPFKLKANYTIKSLQSEYQYKGIHKSKFEKCRNEVDPLKGEDSFKRYIPGAPVPSPLALVSDERNAYCQYYPQNL